MSGQKPYMYTCAGSHGFVHPSLAGELAQCSSAGCWGCCSARLCVAPLVLLVRGCPACVPTPHSTHVSR